MRSIFEKKKVKRQGSLLKKEGDTLPIDKGSTNNVHRERGEKGVDLKGERLPLPKIIHRKEEGGEGEERSL